LAAGPLAAVVPPSRRRLRALLAVGIAVGLVNFVLLPLSRPAQLGLATRVYTVAGEAALAGQPFYGVAPPGLEGYHFIYPPVVALAVLPYGLLGDATLSYLLQTGLSLLAGLALARLIAGQVERAGVAPARRDRRLIAGLCCVSTYTVPTLVNGQVNLLLGLAIAAGLVAADDDRPRPGGAALALAAMVKLFPVTLGAYLLRRRRWEALAWAVATGVGLAGLGLLVFGIDTSVTYLTTVVPSEVKTGALLEAPLAHDYQTVRRQLAAVWPDLPAAWLPAAAAAVVVPPVAFSYRRLDGPTDRWFAVLATLVGTLLVLPLEPLYFPLLVFPLVALLYVVPRGQTRALLFAGTLLTILGVTPSALETFLAGGLLPPGAVAAIRAVVEPVFRVILPGTVGMWLWLAAAVNWQSGGRQRAAEPAAAN
jgi:hypothetical protein